MSRLFAHIPSVQELLEAGPLKAVVERVGRNQVVSETARYLDRLRQQAQTAAQQALHVTTQDLASRVARWISATAPSGQRSIINATGVLLPSDLVGPPLATEAIDALAHTGGAYQSGDQLAAVSSLLNRRAGTEAALVFPSASAALLAAMAALGGGKELVLRRGELERDPTELALDELAHCAGTLIREVGSVNETSVHDYERVMGPCTAAILSVALRNSSPGSLVAPDLKELALLAARRAVPLIADLGWSGFVDLAPFGLSGQTTARAAREAGVDMLVLRGHGCIGGPICGILAGRGDLMEQVARHPFARSAKAPAPTLAALTSTLQLYEDEGSVYRVIPLLSLLTTPVENLKLRAERLAPQFGAMPAVAAAEPIETHALLAGRSIASEQISSWGIALTPATGSPAELASQLLSGTQSVAAQLDGERVVMNLRSVAPKYDLALLDSISALAAVPEQSATTKQTADS